MIVTAGAMLGHKNGTPKQKACSFSFSCALETLAALARRESAAAFLTVKIVAATQPPP